MTAPTTYYKLDVQGIVYLVNPANSIAYTYNISNPVEIGKVIWSDPTSPPRMEFLPTWQTIMDTEKVSGLSVIPI